MRAFLLAGLTLIGVVLLLSRVAFSQPLFGPPVNLGPVINTSLHESDPFLTADGRNLFFVRDFDIWYAEWNGSAWNTPVKLGPQINTGPGIEHSPSVSSDGQKLYFVSDSRSGFLWDIWVSTFDFSMNDWGTPVNLGWPVNTPGTEFSAHLAPDDQQVYFSSLSDSVDSLNPTGRCGIYVSVWDGANWSIPVKILISGCAIDDYPSVTIDGRWFYFDRFVPDSGRSVFVSPWTGSDWGFPYDLRSQIGGGFSPFITPSGESLFFASSSLSGFGGSDIWSSELVSLGVGSDPPGGLLPRSFELYQNYPNPFNRRTRVSYFISQRVSEPVNLTVFNLLGISIRRLIENERIGGTHEIEWDGTDDTGKEVSSGIYFFKLQVGGEVAVKKAIILK